MNEIKKLEHFNINYSYNCNERAFKCLDCNKNTLLYHDYMLNHDLWRELTKKNERESIICWNCIEKRSKRTLKTNDLLKCPANRRTYVALLIKEKKFPIRISSAKFLWDIATRACFNKKFKQRTCDHCTFRKNYKKN